MSITRWIKVSLVACLLLLCAPRVWGQMFYGSIVGTVQDPSGAVIADATVTVTNLGTSDKRSGQSSSAGFYQFVTLVPGQYRVEAEKSGFMRFIREPVVVEVQTTTRIDVSLVLGAVTQSIKVTAQTPLLESQTASLGQVVDARNVQELPLNGRNVLNLAAVVPGVVPLGQAMGTTTGENPYAAGNYEINGALGATNAILLDGATVIGDHAAHVNLIPTQDSVQEFKVETNNLSAEWGRFAGGVINFTTKSGTNLIHGTAYDFLRNKVLNANNFFNNESGIPVSAFTQNQFGADAGGPLYIPGVYDGRNKTFWFVSYEGFRQRYGETFVTTVPTLDERKGDFSNLRDSNGNVIPIYDPTTTVPDPANPGHYLRTQISCDGQLNVICNINPVAKALTNLWAPPNLPGAQYTNVDNFATSASTGGDQNQYVARLDHTISEKQRIFARYTYWNNLSLSPDPYGTHVYQDRGPETMATDQFVLGDNYSLSPKTLLDIHASYMRFTYARTPASVGIDLTTLGFPAALNAEIPPTLRALPTPCVDSNPDLFCSYGMGSVIVDASDQWDFVPAITRIWGRHTLKIGGEIRVDRDNYAQTNNASPGFDFNEGFTASDPFYPVGGYGFASFLMGYAADGNTDIPSLTAGQQIYRGVYAQDNIHATNKLTLNLGLRYDLQGNWSERHNRLSFLDANVANSLAAPTGLPLKGDLELVDSPERASRNNINLAKTLFAPRFGFAYAATNKTVFRGGFGVFWLPNNLEFWLSPNLDAVNDITTPMAATINGGITPYDTLSNPFPNGINLPPGRNSIYESETLGQTVETELPAERNPYMMQWNFDIQRELPGGTLLDVAYAGSRGVHLHYIQQTINQLPDQDLSLGTALDNQVANPFYGLIANGPLSTSTVSVGQLLRPYPQYDGLGINGIANRDSIYHSVEVKAEKRFTKGGTLLVSYTVSKLITTADALFGWLDTSITGMDTGYVTQDANNIRGERSVSDYDVPQRLVVSYALDLPFGRGKKFLSGTSGVAGKLISGWGVNGVTTEQSGFPLILGTAENLTGSYDMSERPNFNSSVCPNGAALHGSPVSRLNGWFNTNCYSQPPAFTFGDVSATLPNVRSDGIHNFDFALFKNTTFGPDGRLGLQFRAEFFNLFNTPQFGTPYGYYGAPQFGIVSSQINNPRLVQFALRLSF